MSNHSIATRATRFGVASALAVAAVSGLATAGNAAVTPTAAAGTPMTLSTYNGGTSTNSTITATTTVAKFYAGKVSVEFQSGASCSATYTATSTTIFAATSNIISSKKITITVPTITTAGSYMACAYSGSTATTSPLLAKSAAAFTLAAPPNLASGTIAPAKGSVLGGQTITVTGTGFTSSMTGTLGGQALTDVTYIDSTTFTATTPVHAAGAAALTITTAGGTSALSGAYTYVNSIQVTPQTGVSGQSYTLDITGTGFNGYTFDSDGTALLTDDNHYHVYLLDPTGYSNVAGSPVTNKATPQKNECVSVAVISDSEMVCTLDLGSSSSATINTALDSATDTAEGLYRVALVSDGTLAPLTTASVTSVSSTSTFTVSDF
jgi:hypothetical protein